METTSSMNYAGQSQNSNQENPLKKWVIILGALAGLFLCTTIYLAFFAKPTMNTVYKEVENKNVELQSELDALLAEHNRIKKQLARLQNISQEYVKEMDQLYQENKALKEENQQVRADLEQEREVTRTIQKSNEDLAQKISNAATYKAYNIKSAGYLVRNKGTEEPTEKANKVKRIKTTLMLGENSLIEPGPVNVYCRIAIPETGKVLTMGSGDTYSFVHNGQRLQYSCKTVVNYNNKAENITLNWDLMSDDKAIKGQYSVQLYTDDQFLGETYFTLR
jgi:uncharacterized protein YoxC